MSLLGQLAVNLVANTQNFSKGMKKAKKETSQLGDKFKQFGGLLVGAVGVGAMSAFARSQLDTIDSLAKTSRQLGITTEALGAYHHAAQLSGMSTDEMDNSLKKMRDTIGAAMMGEAGAITAFRQLGLSAQDIGKAADPLGVIQTRLERIGNQNRKLAIVRDIFGRSGAGALNLFENNLGEIAKRYKELGLAVSSEEAARIEKLNDQMFELGETFQGIGRRLLVDASPTLVRAVDGLNIALEGLGIIRAAGQENDEPSAFEKGRQKLENVYSSILTPLMMANESGLSATTSHYFNRMMNRIDVSAAGL